MSKYGNRKTVVDGYTFDSKMEATRYQELKLLVQAGEISDLQLQPKFELQPAFTLLKKQHRKIEYIADFWYHDDLRLCYVIEDVKGEKTEKFRMKEKMLLLKYHDKFASGAWVWFVNGT